MEQTFEFETTISYDAKATYLDAEKKQRGIRFAVPVHSILLPYITDSERKSLPCRYRVRAGLRWSTMRQGATVKLRGHLINGSRGGQYFHCKYVEILQGVEPAPKLGKRLLKKMAKQIQAEFNFSQTINND
ncbi:hypothetical protein [Runella zeae]|uniref:hypothetical protein n=1 Tax=Runella zeae TaxID=94255 RepID=UPI0004298909|nr:hypothetical protein [Runella zeae]